jgi:hypothetical protein
MGYFEDMKKLRKTLRDLEDHDLKAMWMAIERLGQSIDGAGDTGIFDGETSYQTVVEVYRTLRELLFTGDIAQVRSTFWNWAREAGFLGAGDLGCGVDLADASPPAVMLKRLIEMGNRDLAAACARLMREDALYDWAVVGIKQHEGVAEPWAGSGRKYFYYGVKYVLRLTPAGGSAHVDVADWWKYVECSARVRQFGKGARRVPRGIYRTNMLPPGLEPEVKIRTKPAWTVTVDGELMYPRAAIVDLVMDELWSGDDKQEGREPPELNVTREMVLDALGEVEVLGG